MLEYMTQRIMLDWNFFKEFWWLYVLVVFGMGLICLFWPKDRD